MPDMEKVIYDIERCICHVPDACRDCSHYRYGEAIGCMEELLKDALELLKEQEMVKPKQIIRKQCKKEYEDGSIDYFAEWYCPHCDSLLVIGFDNKWIQFCPRCGKPITWEGR